jgi:hypothetical protein
VYRQMIQFSVIATVALTSIACCCGVFTDYDFDQPDTPANQEGFEQHFGFPAPASVSDLYYFADELGADVKYQLGFTTDQETVDRIVSELDLTQGKPTLDCTGLVREFDWWEKGVVEGLTPWFDSSSQRAYYIEFSL